MVVTIKSIGESFQHQAVQNSLKLLKQREFQSNDGEELVYSSGRHTISMNGSIAAQPGEQPQDWDLNNTQVVKVTFTMGSGALQISGLAMDLRETFQAREIDDLRDWTDFSEHQDYRFLGSSLNDVIKGSLNGINWINGNQDDDILVGRSQKDHVKGGAGDDVIRIKSEAGSFSGGGDDDRFVLKNHSPDIRIMDFDEAHDRIDLRPVLLSLLDGDEAKLDKFDFVGDDDFSGTGFELGFSLEKTDGKDSLILAANIRGEEFELATLFGVQNIDCDVLVF